MAQVNDGDFLEDEDGDLIIENGDFKIGDATLQHVKDILVAAPGHYKQSPAIGADIQQIINGELDADEIRRIRMHLGMDGYKVNDVKQVNGIIQVNVNR